MLSTFIVQVCVLTHIPLPFMALNLNKVYKDAYFQREYLNSCPQANTTVAYQMKKGLIKVGLLGLKLKAILIQGFERPLAFF